MEASPHPQSHSAWHSLSEPHIQDFTLKLHSPTGFKASGSIKRSLNAVICVNTLPSANAGSDDNVPNSIPCHVLRRYRTASTSEDVVTLMTSTLPSSSMLLGYDRYVGCGT
ncbi:hypothetical protein PAXINDRAFT_101725 [Paxillus involutus ATCC 200175]|uniref:Uncharacterized protein n=1 Tax=Paxillus involutus ATCC 200175 TaxID=664439 RepID=A0A0C9TTX8_PAXIN|nr:hypothetical protein PAXINDRAFT_101725 [Paxillus involutus ATCC 200175]